MSTVDIVANSSSSDSTYSLHIVVDGIVDYQPGDVLKIMMRDRQRYDNWDSSTNVLYGVIPIYDYTMDVVCQNIHKGEYAIMIDVSDSTQKYIAFEKDQIGFSRIDDKRTFMRYVKKYDDVQIIFPPFDSIKFSVPETKVMRIILCNPKEGINLTIE